jgi:SAM-dependent methyltransferase
VILADVIEHLDDEQPCLQAAYRALAPGGALIVTVPAYMFLWGPADEINHHKRRYTAARLRRVIEPAFRIEHLTYFNTLLFGVIVAGRIAERVLKRGGDDTAKVPPAPLNTALETVFRAESSVVPRFRLPFGNSVLCVARKP